MITINEDGTITVVGDNSSGSTDGSALEKDITEKCRNVDNATR